MYVPKPTWLWMILFSFKHTEVQKWSKKKNIFLIRMAECASANLTLILAFTKSDLLRVETDKREKVRPTWKQRACWDAFLCSCWHLWADSSSKLELVRSLTKALRAVPEESERSWGLVFGPHRWFTWASGMAAAPPINPDADQCCKLITAFLIISQISGSRCHLSMCPCC